MVIRASSSRQIQTLLDDLASSRASTRDAAIARLTVLGSRAVDRLVQLVTADPSTTTRIGALRALEGIGDPRAVDPILEAVASPDRAVAAAAAAASRVFLDGERGVDVVDRLTTVVMDVARDDAVRLAALNVLLDLKRGTIAPVLEALGRDPSEAIRAAAARTPGAVDPLDAIARAAGDRLPAEPDDLLTALATGGGAAAAPLLLQLIERCREREAIEPEGARERWTLARGRVHVALAEAGSRLALYDLRESIAAAAAPLPLDFLSALSMAGDVSCLEAIAEACARSATAGGSDDWWRRHLVEAFQTIAAREKITRRHAVMKKILKRWPAVLNELAR